MAKTHANPSTEQIKAHNATYDMIGIKPENRSMLLTACRRLSVRQGVRRVRVKISESPTCANCQKIIDAAVEKKVAEEVAAYQDRLRNIGRFDLIASK